MADLDSFFAKKDKKKGKKVKKFTTTEEIAKKLENPEKKLEKSTSSIISDYKREEAFTSILAEPVPEPLATDTVDADPVSDPAEVEQPKDKESKTAVEEEQWNDFKEDTVVDVSSLRITKLNIEEEEEGRGDYRDGGDEGKENSGEDKKEGVWKVEEQKSIQTAICEAVDAGTDEGLEEVKATVAAMSANARWNSQLAKELQPSLLPRGAGTSSRRKKAAPDINNAMAFPSLAEASSNKRKNQDERDASDYRGSHSSSSSGGGGLRGLLAAREQGTSGAYKPPMFRTNNRFGALTDQSSVMRNS